MALCRQGSVAQRGVSTVGIALLWLVSSCGETRNTAVGRVGDLFDGGLEGSTRSTTEAAPLPESGVFCKTMTGSVGYSVAYEVTNVADAGAQIFDAAPRQLGELLVARPDSLAVLSPAGTVVRSFPYGGPVGPGASSHVTLSPAGNAYFTNGDGLVHVFDDFGQPLFTVSPVQKDGAYPESILGATFSDTGLVLVVTFGNIDPDHERPTRWEVRSLAGETLAALPATYGNAQVSSYGEALLVADRNTMTRYSLPSGAATAITTPGDILSYRLSGDGTKMVFEMAPAVVGYIAAGQVVRTYALDSASAIWDLELSPSGGLAIATQIHVGRVSRFRGGLFEMTTALDVEWVNTAAVSERGEIALGGQDSAHGSHLIFLDGNGQVAWECDGPYDDWPFSPWVRFAEDGNAVYAIFADRLMYIRLVRT